MSANVAKGNQIPTSTIVVKIQLPEASSEAKPQALVSNEDKSFVMQIPADLAARRFGPGERKAFFKLVPRLVSKGAFDIGDRVPDPGW